MAAAEEAAAEGEEAEREEDAEEEEEESPIRGRDRRHRHGSEESISPSPRARRSEAPVALSGTPKTHTGEEDATLCASRFVALLTWACGPHLNGPDRLWVRKKRDSGWARVLVRTKIVLHFSFYFNLLYWVNFKYHHVVSHFLI